MKVIVFGGSGLIGTALIKALTPAHEVAVVGRDRAKLAGLFLEPIKVFSWDQISVQVLSQYDVIVNLVGENIGSRRWSSQQKKKILQSRVEATSKIVAWCLSLKNKSPRLFNASAIGVYGLQPTHDMQNQIIYDENSSLPSPPIDFLSEVGSAWESALLPAEEAGIAVVKLRFAPVLSKQGGALAKMLPSFKLGLGAVLGSGQQPFSWVALADVVSAILFLMEQPQQVGAFNIVADEVVHQREFAHQLAAALHRPCMMKLPAAMVSLLFGQMGQELLLNGQSVKASRLKQLGFTFEYPTLQDYFSGWQTGQ